MASEYYDTREIVVPRRNPDGTWTYTFTETQKQRLFRVLTRYGMLCTTVPGMQEDEGITDAEVKLIRALRESF